MYHRVSSFNTRGLGSHFPAKSKDGPRRWHCERTIYAVHMMPSSASFGAHIIRSFPQEKINPICQVACWPHVGGIWWPEYRLDWVNGMWSGMDGIMTLLYYCLPQLISPLLLCSYLFLLIFHWQWFNINTFTIHRDWILYGWDPFAFIWWNVGFMDCASFPTTILYPLWESYWGWWAMSYKSVSVD